MLFFDKDMCTVELAVHLSKKNPCVINTSFGCVSADMMYVNSGCRGRFTCNGNQVQCGSYRMRHRTNFTCACDGTLKPPDIQQQIKTSTSGNDQLAPGKLLTGTTHTFRPWKNQTCTSRFHGCPTLTDRNQTLLTARRCLWAHLFGEASKWAASKCQNQALSSGETYCGYTSAAAIAWLRSVHNETQHCTTVRYTVITGGYDLLTRIFSPINMKLSPFTCNIAFVDAATRATTRRAAHGWQVVDLPDPPPFDSPARVAHSLKASGLRLFPSAAATLFTDGKVLLSQPLSEFLAEAAALSDRPYMVVENSPYASSDPVREFYMTGIRLKQQISTGQVTGEHLAADLADLAQQQRLYKEEVLARPPEARRLHSIFHTSQPDPTAHPSSLMKCPLSLFSRTLEPILLPVLAGAPL